MLQILLCKQVGNMWAPDAGELLGAAAPEPSRQPDRRASSVLNLENTVLHEFDPEGKLGPQPEN